MAAFSSYARSRSLRRHALEIHGKVFHNLTQTQGAEVILSVDTFLTQIDELAGDSGAGAGALAVLRRHGLTEPVVTEARGLIAQTTSLSVAEGQEREPEDDVIRRETEMWEYFLQWSAIAPVAIRDRRLLCSLGFLERRRNSPGDEDQQPDNDESAEIDGEPGDDIADEFDDSGEVELASVG